MADLKASQTIELPAGTALFISDIHLRREGEERYLRLCAYLEALDNSITSLVVVGDLFDFWIGDNRVLERRYARLFAALESLSRRGIRIVYLEGNHDFALGPRLVSRLGLTATPNDAELRLGKLRIYAAHGDLINPADVGYRILRRLLRSRPLLLLARLLPDILVAWIAEAMSRSSRAYTDRRGGDTSELFRRFAEERISGGYDLVVLGHTHVPAYLELESGGRRGLFVNLGGWPGQAAALRVNPQLDAPGPGDCSVEPLP